MAGLPRRPFVTGAARWPGGEPLARWEVMSPSAHSRGSPERRVQLADQFADPSTATRGDWVTPQDVHDDGIRKGPRLRDVVVSDGGIVSGGEFERSCGMSGRSEDVLDLSSFRQWVEERRTDRVAGSAGSVTRRSLSRIAGLLSRPVCRPRAVTERLGPLATIRERLGSVDRVSWAPIVRAFTFEDRQCRPRARHRVAGDLPEFGPAEFDRRGFIRHGVILLHTSARRGSETFVSVIPPSGLRSAPGCPIVSRHAA